MEIVRFGARVTCTADAHCGLQSLDGGTLVLSGIPARITVEEIFEELDEARRA